MSRAATAHDDADRTRTVAAAQVNAFFGFSIYSPQGVILGTQNGDVSEKDIN